MFKVGDRVKLCKVFIDTLGGVTYQSCSQWRGTVTDTGRKDGKIGLYWDFMKKESTGTAYHSEHLARE